jgi:hypothetical protein
MKPTLIVLALLFTFNAAGRHKKEKTNLADSLIKNVVVRYDPNILRIPGNSLPVGIAASLKNGRVVQTKGYLNGTVKLNKYHIEAIGGKYFNGKIKINGDEKYKKDEAILVNVYTRKGKKFLKSQIIPYNYESELNILTAGDYALAPGNRIKIGLRTIYNNEMYTDYWPSSSFFKSKNFLLIPNGGYISGGKLVINSDPFTIENHTVQLAAFLTKNADISDTLKIILDYIDDYQCSLSGLFGMSGTSGFDGLSGSNGSDGGNGSNGWSGPDLDVFTDVYYDTIIDQELMYVRVLEPDDNKEHNYLINTQGGSIQITSRGGSGGDGGNGGNGGSGATGETGTYTTRTEWLTDSTSTTVTEQEPGGRGGDGGNGGNGGYGGQGGNGGNIYISYTPNAEPFLFMISAQSIGGMGGSGGWGGSGGSGGSGGLGNPSGSSGNSGCGGSSGISGCSGSEGKVYYDLYVPE